MISIPYNPPMNRRRLIPAAIVVLASFVLPAYQSLLRAADLMGVPVFALLAAGRPMMDGTGRPIMQASGQPRLADGTSDDCCCGSAECSVCDTDADSYTLVFLDTELPACYDEVSSSIEFPAGTIDGTYSVTRTGDPCIWNDYGPDVEYTIWSDLGCTGSDFDSSVPLHVQILGGGVPGLVTVTAGTPGKAYFIKTTMVSPAGECWPSDEMTNDITDYDYTQQHYGRLGTVVIT